MGDTDELRAESTDIDDDLMDEVIGEFLVESYEGLDRLDQDLVALEDDAGSETLASVFRTMHTIKGTCGFLGFGHLEAVAHAAESLLAPLRDGDLQMTPDIATALLSAVDAVREMLGVIEQSGSDGDRDFAELIAELTRLQDPAASAPKPRKRVGDLLIERAGVRPEDIELAFSEQALGDRRPIGEILIDHGVVAAETVAAALEAQSDHRVRALTESTVRVDVKLLDSLMNLVGELVLTRNRIIEMAGSTAGEALLAPAQQLNLITSELQDGVMRTRMQPIGNVWKKFPRVVRDLAHACGKQIHIDMDGVDTELDKTIVEAIKDPLTHLLRNSVDHGIELPEARVAAGKQPEGRLTLRAFHEGGQVIIEISDDGAGIDVAKVGAKAVAAGLVTPDALATMTTRQVVDMIFLPGFSTAEVVTNVSGRGVGMDVVKTNIEQIGGSLEVSTEPGIGSTFRIKIPLTLAIIPALVVGCGSHRFAVPQVNLLELVRVTEGSGNGIEWVQGAPLHRLRGRLLPVVDLSRHLGLGGPGLAERTSMTMAVVQADGRRFGVVVDQITDTQEIVVKPLSAQVNEAGVFAGATIMGDGQIALILDVLGLAHLAGIEAHAHDTADAAGSDERRAEIGRDSVLVVDVGRGHRAAIDLASVARLEQLPRSAIERSSRGTLVQYRGELLRLVSLGSLAGIGDPMDLQPDRTGMVDVIVWSDDNGLLGLAVDGIIDIVEEDLSGTAQTEADPRSGTYVAVVGGHATDVVDVSRLVAS